MQDRYVSCYVSGRMDSFEGEIDLEKLVERIGTGAPVRETTLEVARKAVTTEMDAAAKVQWLQDNLEAIRAMGGDTEKAWRMFCQGRIDALAVQLDENVMEELVNQLEDEEDEDDDEEDGDEGDEDGDDEDEDDDDDDEEEED